MAKTTRNFIVGRMNKSVDERLIPNGEYIHAENVRLGSTENSEIGSVENSKGNKLLVTPYYPTGSNDTHSFKCLGSYADSANETIYWFVHADNVSVGATQKLDMILSYDVVTQFLTYHVVSIDDGGGENTTLDFSDTYLINGINKVDNLLFFTDNRNPPRFIDINKNYQEPNGNIDQFSAEDLLVIKRPPNTAPTLALIRTAATETYLDERFVCFAYRYKYANNEYSATSQWTQPAFTPKTFNLSLESSLNEGMVNQYNAVNITYNTGSSLVTEIQVLFKEADNNIIKVIESFNKEELGLGDNNNETIMFDNSKIFTLLADSEILRLYDNVPLLAKSQTLMGNRMMYGNYYEGYDLVDSSDNPIDFNYTTSLVATPVNENILIATKIAQVFQVDCTSGSAVLESIDDAAFSLYLTDDGLATGTPLELKAGAMLDIDMQFEHAEFGGDISGAFTPPTDTTPTTDLVISFLLPRDYANAYDLATSEEFRTYMGSPLTIKEVNECLDGVSVSDQFNCALPNNLGGASGGTLTKCWSAVLDTGCTGGTVPQSTAHAVLNVQPGVFGLSDIRIGLMAMAYVDTCVYDGEATATQVVWEFYKFTQIQPTFKALANPASLHSNRNYETAIIYMDEYKRSSTPLVSSNNTVAVPCANADSKNQIKVEIPATMHPPKWAKTYKFAVQPDRSGYNVIYTNLFFKDPKTTRVWCLLEGENSQKIEKGDRLIVKRDSNGVMSRCVYTTVLEKEVQIEDFIDIDIEGTTEKEHIPAGAYMAVTPDNWAATVSIDGLFSPGNIRTGNFCYIGSTGYQMMNCSTVNTLSPKTYYEFSWPTGEATPTNANPEFRDVTVPQGSVINWYMEFKRKGPADGDNACEQVIYELDLEGLVSQNNYANVYEWFVGDNIQSLLDDGVWTVGDQGSDGTLNFVEGIRYQTSSSDSLCVLLDACDIYDTPADSVKNFYLKFFRINNAAQDDNTSNLLGLFVQGGKACGGNSNRKSCITMRVSIFRSERTLVFESEPTDAAPGVYFEGNQTFDINNNFHESGTATGDQNQTATQPAIITLDTSNCYSYGNGVESYQIRDSIEGKSMNLGNRAYGASEQIYKRAHRFADITYSGIYNDESNINKLNEFNLGLINFKALEDSYGGIEVLSGRKTDVLCLQEDKISYVLAGKNLLSDASGGSALTSVPEVLGTQISRIEKYGISNNPESFTEWGADKFFTDAKRGAIIQLKGASADSEQLGVISEVGMRGYFRDLFNDSFQMQKIGGFDPYMNEYVLSINHTLLPTEVKCYSCGVSLNFEVEAGTPQVFCYTLTAVAGNAILNYYAGATQGGTTTFVASWTDSAGNTATASSGAVTADGFITVIRDIPTITKVTITVTQSAGIAAWTINQACPTTADLTVIQVCLTNPDEASASSYNQFYWNTFADPQPAVPYYTNPTYTSTTTSNFIDFAEGEEAPTVSQYMSATATLGLSGFPPSNSYVTIQSNQLAPANFTFDATNDKFYWLESNTLYQNNSTDITNLLAAATVTNTEEVTAGVLYRGQFARTTNTTYLYLIWDYRSVVATNLSYQVGTADLDADTFAACCLNTPTAYYLNGSTLSTASVVYDNSTQTTPATDGYYSDGEVVRLQKLSTLQPATACACGVPCGTTSYTFKTQFTSVFKATHYFSATTGAVVITWVVKDMPKGVMVTYNGVVYNKWVSSVSGDVSPDDLDTPVYLGKTSSGTPPSAGNYQVAELNSTTGTFLPIPATTQYVAVTAGEIKTQGLGVATCTLVFPKTSATINWVDIEFYNLLSSTDYPDNIYTVACPVSLTPKAATALTYATNVLACAASTSINIYHNSGTTFAVNDQIFANANGDLAVNTDATSPGYGNRLYSAGGWVKIAADSAGTTAIQLSDESIITAIYTC